MKKANLSRLLFALSLCITLSSARAQYVAIPDTNFGKWLNTNGYASCLTGNNTIGYQLDTSCSAVLSANYISCSYANIHNLSGIQYFKNITNLTCEADSLTGLPTLPAGLTSLDCIYNQITSLPSLPAGLTSIQCGSNQLTNLPTLPAGLILLICSVNQLTNLPTLPAGLIELHCSENQLTSLPTLPTSLNELYCADNHNLICLPHIYQDTMHYFYISGTAIKCLPNRFLARIYDTNPDTMHLCDSASGCAYTISTDIINLTSKSEAHLYPSPNKGSFTLQTSGIGSISYTITDMMGNLIVKQSIAAQSQVINLPNVADGIYMLKVEGAEPLRFEVMK